MGQDSGAFMQWLNKIQSLLPKKQSQKDYFLALILKEKSVKAAIFEEKEGQVAIIDKSTVSTDKMLEEIADDELLGLVDQAIGVAEKSLPTSTKTAKTIFGLSEWWVENTAIKEPYLGKIKIISKNLELTPIGFVVIPEAISHLLKIEEGMPPTVLLVFLGENHIGVTLVRAGRIEASKTVAKEEKSDSETAAAIIKSFGNIEILPSRMFLFDGEVSLEEAKQEFLSFPWTKELSFLHFPKIDIVSPDYDAKGVVSGAAKEMGLAFEEEKATPMVSEVAKKGEDSAESEQEKPEEEKQEIKTDEDKESKDEETFGFVAEHDVMDEEKKQVTPVTLPVVDDEEDEKLTPKLASQTPTLSNPLKMISPLLRNFRIPSIRLPSLKFNSVPYWLPVGTVVFIVVLFVLFYIFIPTATITLSPQTRALEKDVAIIIDVNSSSVDKEKKKIPAKVVEIDKEGEKSQPTTGKKTVGDRAKGEVTIYNKTENRKTFSKGTLLTGPSDLRFSLDDEVTVASTSAFELTPSSVKAKLIANQIGEESNLGAGTNFPFKDFPTSSYFAKNDSAFSGGTKREVVVVSKEDQENLLTALTQDLQIKAEEELSKQSQDYRIVDVDMKQEVTTKKYNKNVGEEADTVMLTLGLNFSTLAYKDADLLELIENEITKVTPQGFIFEENKFETTIKTIAENKDGSTSVQLRYKALLIPDLKGDDIRNSIAGKTKEAVEAYLKSLPLETYKISQNIELPPPFDLLPQRSANIHVEIGTH